MPSILQQVIGRTSFRIRDEALGIPVMTGLKIASVEIGGDSSVAEQPIQSRDLTQDQIYIDLNNIDIRNSRIIRPIKIRMTCISDNPSDIETIERNYADPVATFEITSRQIIAAGMVIAKVRIEQTPKMISANKIIIEFEQGNKPITTGFDPDNPSNSSDFGLTVVTTENRGDVVSLFDNVSNQVTGLYNRISQSLGF